jgi:GNAT superfamily N-acetyltransferase
MQAVHTIRVALRTDIPAMHKVRMAVHENRLVSTFITEEHYISAIEVTGRGWVAEHQGAVIGFAVGNAVTGNLWALFVHPDHEGRGHGRRLHDAVVDWLFQQRLPRLWLSTEPNTRAQRFYEKAGWSFVGTLASGEAHYELR